MPPDRAAWAVDLLLHFATSTAAEQGTRERAIDADDEEDALVTALREAPADTFPHIAALGAESSCPAPARTGSRGVSGADQRDPPDAPGREPGAAPMTASARPRRAVRDSRPPAAADPTRLTTRLRLILAVVLLADVLDLMDSTITNIAAPTSSATSAAASR